MTHVLKAFRHGAGKIILALSVLAVLLAVPYQSIIAQPTIQSEITPSTGHIDDLFLFTVTLEGHPERISPQLSAGGDFEIQFLGPKTSISIVNGQMHSRQQFVYQLIPKREGTLKTPEAQVILHGDTIAAKPIPVTIKSLSRSQDTSAPQTGEQIFMRQTLAPTTAFVGQQLVNAITVYTRVNLRGVRIEDDAADGFWQENISDGNNAQRTINGVEYGSAQLLRALFPLRSGELAIPARKAIVQVPVSKRLNPLGNLDPFSDDFFSNFFKRSIIQEKTLASNELSISILPLPAIPNDLQEFVRGVPIVGDTSVSIQFSEAPLNVGESRNLALIVTSTGHLNPIKPPSLIAPPGIKIYNGQNTSQHTQSEGQLITQKTFNYSIVPTEPGIVRIPGISIAFFDPDSKEYKLATTSDLTFVVSGVAAPVNNNNSTYRQGKDAATSAPPPIPPQQSTTSKDNPGPVLLPYSPPTLLDTVKERVSIQLAILILVAAIILVFLSSILIRISSSKARSKEILQRVAKSADARELEQHIRSWAIETLPGVRDAATFDEIRSLIRSSSQSASTKLIIVSALDELEAIRYAPSSPYAIETIKSSVIQGLKTWSQE